MKNKGVVTVFQEREILGDGPVLFLSKFQAEFSTKSLSLILFPS
jgi:hypothetical protein